MSLFWKALAQSNIHIINGIPLNGPYILSFLIIYVTLTFTKMLKMKEEKTRITTSLLAEPFGILKQVWAKCTMKF